MKQILDELEINKEKRNTFIGYTIAEDDYLRQVRGSRILGYLTIIFSLLGLIFGIMSFVKKEPSKWIGAILNLLILISLERLRVFTDFLLN